MHSSSSSSSTHLPLRASASTSALPTRSALHRLHHVVSHRGANPSDLLFSANLRQKASKEDGPGPLSPHMKLLEEQEERNTSQEFNF